jgi:hypothetical protein
MNPSHFYLYAWASVWEYPKHPWESTLGPIRNHHVEGGDQPSAEPAVRSTPCGPDWPYPLARWLVCGPLGVSLADVRNKVGLGTSWNQALSRSTFDFARLKTLLFCFFWSPCTLTNLDGSKTSICFFKSSWLRQGRRALMSTGDLRDMGTQWSPPARVPKVPDKWA